MIHIFWSSVRLFISIALAGAASMAVAQASELGDLGSSMEPGEWAELSTSGMNDDLLVINGYHAFEYSDALKWDPIRQEVHFTGSGHQVDYKHVVYSETSNSWSERAVPSYFTTGHAYDHLAIDPVGRRYFLRGYNANELDVYDLDSMSWSRGSSFSGTHQVAGGMAWSPDLQRVILLDERLGVLAYNAESDSWSTIAEDSEVTDLGKYHNFAEYSAPTGITLMGGGNGSQTVYRMDSSGNVTRASDAPVDLGIVRSVVTVDPASGRFLVVAVNGNMYEYNPGDDQWRQVSTSIPSVLLEGAGDGGSWGLVATPIPEYGVTFFAKYNGDNSKVYLYKHSESTGTAPPIVSLGASPSTVSSGGSTTLNWSTSNADSCSASGGWSGSKSAAGGSEEISNLTSGATFGLSCSGAGGTASADTTVTVESSGGGGGSDADADWTARSTAPGVLMATRFDTQAEVGDWETSSMQENVTWDQNRKTSGSGSMRMAVLKTDTTSSGNWRRWLSDDEREFGPGDEFYVQYRQYIPAYLIEHKFEGTNYSGQYSQGFKSSIISHFENSNTNFEVVIQNSGQLGYIQGYHQDGVNTAIKWDESVDTECLSTDFVHQPAIDHGPQNVGTPCENDRARYGGLYSYLATEGGDRGDPDPFTGAFVYEKDAWITILQHVRVSPSGYASNDNLIETWAAKDGEDYVLLVSDNNVKFGGAGQFDALWLLHYRSNGQSDSSRQDTFTNYDEVIVSTDFISAPGHSEPSQVKTPENPTQLEVE